LITNHLLIYVASHKKFTLGVFTQPATTAVVHVMTSKYQKLK
jgi:hypothetical protein